MSGLEVFAVVSAVAAVISAYKDGSRIVAQIKAKRAHRKAPPPTKFLEESLSRGPLALEEAKNNGVERFGAAFATGDSKWQVSENLGCRGVHTTYFPALNARPLGSRHDQM